MYDERLAYEILNALNSRYPETLHLHELKEAVKSFSSSPDEEWLHAVDALLTEGKLTGKVLRSGDNQLEDAAMLRITSLGRESLQKSELPLQAPQGTLTEAEQGKRWVEQLTRRLASERNLFVTAFEWWFDFNRRVHWLRANFGGPEMTWSFSDEQLQDSVADRHVQRELQRTLATYFIPDGTRVGSELERRKMRSYEDPYPADLIGVEAELDYWAGRQGEGEPGSIHETRVQQRLDHLRNLEQRFLRRKRGNEPILQPNEVSPSPNEWDAFISYAREDRQFVEPLYEGLKAAGLNIWFDQFELTIGDSLRDRIDFGLAHSRFGIVILSPSFLAKHWTRQELDGLAAKEVHGVKVILPVWHNIDEDGVAAHSPLLAGRLAAKSSEGVAAVVSQLLRAIQRDSPS